MKYSLIHMAASIWITFGTILLCFFGAAILSVSQSSSRSDQSATAQCCKTWVLGFFNAINNIFLHYRDYFKTSTIEELIF